MQLHLHVTFNDDHDPVDVVTSLFDVVKLERKYDIAATTLASEMRFEWLAFLAREAMRSDGHTVPSSLDEFLRLRREHYRAQSDELVYVEHGEWPEGD